MSGRLSSIRMHSNAKNVGEIQLDDTQWLKQLIITFRAQAERLSSDQKAKISNLDNLFQPCQALMISFIETKTRFLLWIKNDKSPDMELDVRSISCHKAIETFEAILKDQKYNRELTEEERKQIYPSAKSFSAILESLFLNKILNKIRQMQLELLFADIDHPGVGGKGWVATDSFTWEINGDLEKLDINQIVNDIMESARRAAEQEKSRSNQIVQQPATQQSNGQITGHSTYFYPPIWIGSYQL